MGAIPPERIEQRDHRCERGARMATRPNLLVLMSDQHNPHVMGCEGDTVVRTPHLDRLAAEGVLFENCYCPAPLCVPSRMSFMTSRHPSGNEVWSNQCMLPSDAPTFAHALGAAGYETVLNGRMHFMGADQRHGFETRLADTITCSYVGGMHKALRPELLAATGQSRVAATTAGPGRTGYQGYDETVARAAVEFLRRRAAQKDERPFCLVCGFVLPHCPFVCRREDFDYYLDRVTIPQFPPGYFETLHPAMRLWRKNRDIEDLTEEQIRRARAGYYGLVEHFNRQLGKVLEALDASGLAENTMVVYTSDHGEMAGEHGMWWKSNFYEGAASVPLIVSHPGRIAPGRRSGPIVNLIDIGPTLIQIAGADPLPDVPGRSLAPLLRGEDAEWRDETFSEHHACLGLPPMRMVRSGPWKLVHFDGDRPQLFNLDDDPDEFCDLGEDPQHAGIRRELTARVLADWSAAHMEQVLERRRRGHRLLAEWYRTVNPPLPEHWGDPPEATVFPGEEYAGEDT